MTIKNIVVHMDDRETCRARVDVAVEIARAYDAHLVGVYVWQVLAIPNYAQVQIPLQVLEAQETARKALARVAKDLFTQATDKAGLKAEWRCEKGDAVDVLTLNARYADLVVAGQSPEGEGGLLDEAVVDHVALQCGRPVLVIPYIGAQGTIGKRVYVAWDGSREAVRAVNDSLPFLERADAVRVVAINAGKSDMEHGDIPCADICLHLARHGISAEAYQVESGDLHAGDMLLSRAADGGADLLVMGAYGHSRFKELVLGGVTRHLLHHMTIPVLMSH